jgi:hypothetical protein
MAFSFFIELHLCIYVSLVTKAFFFPTLGHLKNSKISWIHIREKNQNICDVFSNKRKNFPPFLFFLGASNLSQGCSLVSILLIHSSLPTEACNVILTGHHHKENMDCTPKISTLEK